MSGFELFLRYLGPVPWSPYGMCCYLPQLAVGLFEKSGYLTFSWLFWSLELNWKRGV